MRIEAMSPEELAQLRRENEITQVWLASRLLVSQATLSRWETRKRPVSPRDLRAWRAKLKHILGQRRRRSA